MSQLSIRLQPTRKSQKYFFLNKLLQLNIMKMLVCVFLVSSVLAQTVLVNSDPSTTTLLSPSSETVAVEAYHHTAHPDYLGTGASWIWINGSANQPSGFKATFQAIFYADCPQVDALVTIAAEDSFRAWLNGVSIGSGDDWQNISSFTVQLKCGWNNLTVTVQRVNGLQPALIFSVQQNQEMCYKCSSNPLAIYDRRKCECTCSSWCRCWYEDHDWFGYPDCGCKCKKNNEANCSSTNYWDQRHCQCRCKPKWCPKGYKQDDQTCECKCYQKCSHKYQWDEDECKCVPKGCRWHKWHRCRYGKVWDPDNCSCECPALKTPCKYGRDEDTCRCHHHRYYRSEHEGY